MTLLVDLNLIQQILAYQVVKTLTGKVPLVTSTAALQAVLNVLAALR